VLRKKEIEEFDAMHFGKVSWLQRRLESKILDASSKVISGEEFGEKALQQARLIQQSAAQLQAKTKKADRDREGPHSSPLPHHAAYGSVLRDSADPRQVQVQGNKRHSDEK